MLKRSDKCSQASIELGDIYLLDLGLIPDDFAVSDVSVDAAANASRDAADAEVPDVRFCGSVAGSFKRSIQPYRGHDPPVP